MMGRDLSAIDAAIFIGDLHEHPGQLIACARMTQIVSPWTK